MVFDWSGVMALYRVELMAKPGVPLHKLLVDRGMVEPSTESLTSQVSS